MAFVSKVFAAPVEKGAVGEAGPRIAMPSARSFDNPIESSPSSPPALLEERKRMFVYFSLVP